MSATTMLGWHWLAADRRMQYGDRQMVEAGKTYHATGPLVMCHNGLHAARRALDALKYAPGPIVCRVRLGGPMLHDTDKSVARTRTVLWMADATTRLHEFGLICGEHALGQYAAVGMEPDARSWAILDVKRRWLKGNVTDEELARAAEAAEAAWAAGAAWAAWAAGAARAAEAAWAAGTAEAARAARAAGAAGAAGAAEAAWAAWTAGAARAAWAAGAAGAADTQNLILELLLESLR